MKIEKLVISNIGIIGNEEIVFNKALNLFYGDVRQGKTTILNAIKWVFGGAFPDDIIKHGERKASIELYFDTTCIIRKFRKDKHGVTKAEKIEFADSDGGFYDKPVDAIKQFLNPFLLNQNHLVDMNEPSRKRFFVDLFGVDTSSVDKKLKTLEDDAKELRATIKGYGEISPVKVDKPDIDFLKEKKKVLIDKHDEKCKTINQRNGVIEKINSERSRGTAKIIELEKEIANIKGWLQNNPFKEPEDLPVLDTASIDEKINNASADQIRYEQYVEDDKRRSKKAALQDDLTEKEGLIRDSRETKAALLTTINDECNIKGLVFDDNGDFEYEGTTAGMLSTSQLMRLSGELSSLYPEGFSLELIDRGESMGKSIFRLIDRAEEQEKTILATVVGEKPAEVPEDIGVFVVDNGQIK